MRRVSIATMILTTCQYNLLYYFVICTYNNRQSLIRKKIRLVITAVRREMPIARHILIIMYTCIRDHCLILGCYRTPHSRECGTGGAGEAQAPPSFWDLFSKNFKNQQIFQNIFFPIQSCPPIKNLLPHTLSKTIQFQCFFFLDNIEKVEILTCGLKVSKNRVNLS